MAGVGDTKQQVDYYDYYDAVLKCERLITPNPSN